MRTQLPLLVRKILIAILVLALVSIGVGGYFLITKDKHVASHPVDAIPTSAAIIISYPDLPKSWQSFEAKDYFEALSGVSEFQNYFLQNTFIDSVLRNDEEVSNLFSGSSVWVSYHIEKGGALQLFYAVRPQLERSKKTAQILGRILSNQETPTQYSIGEHTVSEFNFRQSDQSLHFTMKNGLVLISTSKNLVTKSLDQLDRNYGLKSDPGFNQALASSGKNVDVDVFFNYRHFPEYLGLFLKSEVVDFPSNAGSMASWVELDLTLKDDGLAFNGFCYTTDTVAQYLNLFLNQQPQPITFPEMLTANTASFVFFGVNDIISFSDDYRKLLSRIGKLEEHEAKIDSLNSLLGVDIENSMLAWMGNEFGVCVTEPSSSAFAENSYAIFKARSPELAVKLLGDLVDAIDRINETESEVGTIDSVQLRKINLSQILPDLFGPSFEHIDNTCYMILNNYVVFGKSPEALGSYLHYIRADKTLGRELSFSEFSENLGSNFNVFTYSHVARSKHIMESYLISDAMNTFQKNEKRITNFEALGSQITSTGSSFYANAYVKYNPSWRSDEQTSWEATMDNPASSVPVFVKNHHSDEWEVLVQDEKNTLYLFSRFGQEVFRKSLEGPMISRPKQVDAFKNGNLQYVFNTANYIYLVDRNGKDVAGFPIVLPAKAITNLSVIEYDRKRDYRLLITCENKRIYNYNIRGKKVKGWKHNKASDATIHPFKHLFTGGKDYLITGESNGKIHLLDRRGKNRTKVSERVKSSVKNTLQPFASRQAAFSGVYLTNQAGMIYRVALDGKVNEMSIGKFSEHHRFLVSDLNDDGRPEFIFSDLNELKVYNYKKELIIEQRLDPTATEPFIVELKDGYKGVGICFQDPEQLLLYNHKGNLVKGFPISGSAPFDLVIENDNYLVVSKISGTSIEIQALR